MWCSLVLFGGLDVLVVSVVVGVVFVLGVLVLVMVVLCCWCVLWLVVCWFGVGSVGVRCCCVFC